ncbi:hypothetical protein [Cyclobacterium qasimii]|uniref:Uncharacterized protein n=1 Tax=Cyclobacterium qasimii M12-11B TaxID=641524 RepID=S7WDV2_9BACT|nr:hypothetical protein [Cyclobacterium qasimii]EPR64999.1 hypothetical protein ADICYQ_5928 [Cyclobacterium qasimii M12-11B]
MKYTKKYLDNLESNSEEEKLVIEDLLSKATKKDNLTSAESEYVFMLTQLLQGVNPTDKLDHKSFDCCKQPYFKNNYLIYAGNLNGSNPSFDFKGEIESGRKIVEIKELEEEHQEWLPNLSKFNHKDRLMNLIASEANIEIKKN